MSLRTSAALAIAVLAAAFSAHAQSPEAVEYARFHGGQPAAFFNEAEHLTFSFDRDGKLTATADCERDMIILSSTAAAMYNTGAVQHSFFHVLEDFEAHSLLPDGRGGYRTVRATDRVTTAATEDYVFYDDSKQTRVTFPSLEKGARTRLRYTLRHTDVHFLSPVYFGNTLPTRAATFSVTVPKGVDVRFATRNDPKGLIKKTVTEARNGGRTTTFTVRDMPGITLYPNAPEPSYYMPQVVPYVASYTAPGASRPTAVYGTPDDLYRYYYGFVRELNLRPDDSVIALASRLTVGAKTPREKAARIYRWVQEAVRYVAFEDGMGGFVPREAGLVCSRRFGDCKDMSSLQVALYRAAGLEAYYTWIGTRDLPYTYAETPLPIVTNHMIAALKMDDAWVFADGTDPTIPFGHAPHSIQGKEAMISLGPDKYEIVKVPVAEGALNTTADSTRMALGADGGTALGGSVHIRYTGYDAWNLAARMRYANATDRRKALEALTARGSNKYGATAVDYGAPDAAGAVAVRSDFKLEDYARRLGGETYVNLNLQRTFEGDAIDAKARAVPVEHSYKTRTREVVELAVPKGYKVSYVPPDAQGGVPGLWSYAISYKKTGAVVKLVKEFQMNTLSIRPEQFAEHDKLVESLRGHYKESVVLVKE